MLSGSLFVLAAAVQFTACPGNSGRIFISDDCKTAHVNTDVVREAERDALAARALLLLERAKPAEPANPMTPLMGWSSWNTFAEHISDDIIKGVARAMATNGLKKAGYVYVNIDDGFFNGHGPDGRLRFNPTRFPDGLKGVVDTIHSLGMKAGIYSDAGDNTCASYAGDKSGRGAGLYGHDAADCTVFFNELGFDYIKVDYCGALHLRLEERKRYTEISDAIKATGRKGVRLNICRWAFPGTWARGIAGSWRTTCDIRANWRSIMDIIAENLYLSAYAAPGGFNDLDMLEVGQYKGAVKSAFGADGDTGLTADEETAHFGMWCIMTSPLVLGCDVRSMPATTYRLVTNPYLIAMNQDPLGLQAYVVARDGAAYQLVKDAYTRFGNSRYVAFYNAGDSEKVFTVKAADFDLGGRIAMFDLVNRSDIGVFENECKFKLRPHSARFFIFDAEKRLDRTVYEAETAYLSDYCEIDESSFGNLDSCREQGRAYPASDAKASGGVAVMNLGRRSTNDLIWNDVKLSTAGRRKLVFRYSSPSSRTFYLEVNSGAPIQIKVDGTNGEFAETAREIDLPAGVHTIRLFNAWSSMPDIDRMTIEETFTGPRPDFPLP